MSPRFSLILLAACASSPGCSPPKPPPHVILITADTLRADHLSGYGYERRTSPRLDELAETALVFEQALAVIPKTGPSFTTMFTGRYPDEHGVRFNSTAVPLELPVLAERLQRAGYRTAAFVGNPVLRREKRYDRGFDLYRSFGKSDPPTVVRDAFLEWAADAWDRPTFVWIHFMDPHGPYEPQPEFERLFLGDEYFDPDERIELQPSIPPGGHKDKVLGGLPAYHRRADGEDRVAAFVARYDAEIRGMDRALGDVLDALRARDLFDPSVVVFSADHGESLGEHDYWFEHGWFAFEPTLHVPLLLKTPQQRAGRRSEVMVSHLDLLPTLLALAGQPADPGAEGENLLEVTGERPALLIQNSDRYPEKVRGLRTPRWKVLVRESDGRAELYDLKADPRELLDVALEHPGEVQLLRKELERQRQRLALNALSARAGEADGAQTRGQLEAIGYGGEH